MQTAAWWPRKQSRDRSPLLEHIPLSLGREQGRVGADGCGFQASSASPGSVALGFSSRLKGNAAVACSSSFLRVCRCVFISGFI